MKQSLFTLCLMMVLGYVSANAQIEEKMRKENVVQGTVIVNGQTIEGYIRRMTTELDGETIEAPWDFQETIKFIEKDVFDNAEKIKRKMYHDYNAKTCEGYTYDNGRYTYVAYKYSDNSAIGFNMIAKRMFLRQLTDGKIKFYLHYETPAPVYVGNNASEMRDEDLRRILNEKHLVYYKEGNEKPRLVEHLNVSKEFSDCPKIIEKADNKEYYKDRSAEENLRLIGLEEVYPTVMIFMNRNLNIIEDYNNGICE